MNKCIFGITTFLQNEYGLQNVRKKAFIILLVLAPFLTYGQKDALRSDLSFYWGTSYRVNNNFYHSFDLTNEYSYRSCTRSLYKGLSFRLDHFGPRNNAYSIKYFSSINRRPRFQTVPFWGFSPVIFTMDKHVGLNVKPEIGVRFNSGNYSRRQVVSLNFLLSYGYDIPVINEQSFFPGRHDFNAKIALSLNLNAIHNNTRKKKKNDEVLPQSVKSE